ncbi:MAG TPA: sensor histidine kinase [Geminicoccaceae bacterium]|nr:sensor histidine kinase [Geminicoccaceae bacterium]
MRRSRDGLRASPALTICWSRPNWEGAGLRALVVAQLSPWLEQQDRLRLAGDDVTLPANAALTLGMTLHELATNAAKHGALSTAVGAVEVSWRHEPANAGRQLVLLWQERGGPEVAPPARRSFGTRLIEDGIAYEFGGQVTLEFLPPGLRCELRFPLEPSDGAPAASDSTPVVEGPSRQAAATEADRPPGNSARRRDAGGSRRRRARSPG